MHIERRNLKCIVLNDPVQVQPFFPLGKLAIYNAKPANNAARPSIPLTAIDDPAPGDSTGLVPLGAGALPVAPGVPN